MTGAAHGADEDTIPAGEEGWRFRISRLRLTRGDILVVKIPALDAGDYTAVYQVTRYLTSFAAEFGARLVVIGSDTEISVVSANAPLPDDPNPNHFTPYTGDHCAA
jgi:hypothetical protein